MAVVRVPPQPLLGPPPAQAEPRASLPLGREQQHTGRAETQSPAEALPSGRRGRGPEPRVLSLGRSRTEGFLAERTHVTQVGKASSRSPSPSELPGAS